MAIRTCRPITMPTFRRINPVDWAFVPSHAGKWLKLVSLGRLTLPCPVDQWLRQSLGYPNVLLLPLSPEVAVESCRLPGTFHRDPADQLIVATERVYGCPVVTLDQKIRAYTHGMIAP
jgi:PIN domain nuclease of toxin-antitoxin system